MKFINGLLCLGVILLSFCHTDAQIVCKTPSGEKYHEQSCRHIKNTSECMDLSIALTKHRLSPCKQCKPTIIDIPGIDSAPSRSGVCADAVRCQGWAKSKGRRCKKMTRNCNGYCAQHPQ